MTISWTDKINPLWWFGNRDDPVTPDWHMPGWPYWWRQFVWLFVRNPLHNFTAYVIGVQDREYTFHASKPNTINHTFSDGGGWLFGYCAVDWVRLPFTSYRGQQIEGYLGWHPSGKLALAIRTYKGGQ